MILVLIFLLITFLFLNYLKFKNANFNFSSLQKSFGIIIIVFPSFLLFALIHNRESVYNYKKAIQNLKDKYFIRNCDYCGSKIRGENVICPNCGKSNNIVDDEQYNILLKELHIKEKYNKYLNYLFTFSIVLFFFF